MTPEPLWLSAFLDYPADGFDAGTAYWQQVTDYTLSPARGDDGEFATLVPPDGDDFLRVQRVGDGAPRVHLDLHVTDPRATGARAVDLGATLLVDLGYLTLASPGGLTFCLVTHPASRRPAPHRWADGRASYVDQVCLDVPPSRYVAELDFWHALTGWERRDPAPGSEFGRVTPPPTLPLQLLLQRLDDEQDSVSAHLDWATTDRDAEVADHVAAGAVELARHDWWTVLRDPAGLLYCVTRRPPR